MEQVNELHPLLLLDHPQHFYFCDLATWLAKYHMHSSHKAKCRHSSRQVDLRSERERKKQGKTKNTLLCLV